MQVKIKHMLGLFEAIFNDEVIVYVLSVEQK